MSGTDQRVLHPRAFKVTVGWTLILLLLGSVVHATESSLACPDWPTCFGTMVPEMTGGVFWEHLHRLVAGGLVLMFGLGTWLVRREAPHRPWMFRVSLAGIALLLVQSIFGGLTVIYLLPDLVSTTHLGLAFLFLALATVLATASGRFAREDAGTERETDELLEADDAHRLGRLAGIGAALVFIQSIVGGLVRHMDAGMSCPDAPLCLGQFVPPLVNPLITVHFVHRAFGVLVLAWVIGFAIWAVRSRLPHAIKRWSTAAAWLVSLQVLLGFASVLSVLAVVPVSLHTLVAAGLLAVLVRLATVSRLSKPAVEPRGFAHAR